MRPACARRIGPRTALQYCEEIVQLVAATLKVQHPTALRIGSEPAKQDGQDNNTDSASNISSRREPTVAIFPVEYPAHYLSLPCQQGQEMSTHTRPTAAPKRPRGRAPQMIGRLISHPAPLTCTWRCSGKRSRHPSFGGAPPSGSELLHSNTPSQSQFAARPGKRFGGRVISRMRCYQGALWFLARVISSVWARRTYIDL